MGAIVSAAVGAGTVVWGTSGDESSDTDTPLQYFSCDTTAMQIEFTRSGGFAGMTLSASVNTDSLPEDERRRVCGLVEDADFFGLPSTLADSIPEPDSFSYEITIDDGSRKHTVSTTDSAAPDALIPLLDWLNRAARRRRGG